MFFRTPNFHTPFFGKNSVKIGPNRLKTLLIVFPIHENHIPIEKNKIWKKIYFYTFLTPVFFKNPPKNPLKKFFHDSKPLPIDSPIEKTPCIRENYSFRVEMATLGHPSSRGTSFWAPKNPVFQVFFKTPKSPDPKTPKIIKLILQHTIDWCFQRYRRIRAPALPQKACYPVPILYI